MQTCVPLLDQLLFLLQAVQTTHILTNLNTLTWE